ncbi:hypothetical protein [Arthrobacter sp. B1805]|uniref:hypothetical protein n=1 Tax=Arthrobacter sp. B1805 TaxID=2058892 RepID=UPI0011B0EBC3|nr:hypothetical protein [Arthrobacter sp. B1805]
MKSRITPDEPFPADLGRLRDEDVEILNSKVHREIEHEVAEDGEVATETEFRKAELAEELDDREDGPRLTLVPQHANPEDSAGTSGEPAPGAQETAAPGERTETAPSRFAFDAERN